MSLFEARALCKYYRPGTRGEVRALDDVSLSITAGSFVVITGPSGSGKTTLLALLGALERPTRGEVLFEGRRLNAISDVERTRVRRRMGFVFQGNSLISRLSAWENVAYPLIPRGVARAERYRRAVELLESLGLSDRLGARAEELSGGEQQRVGVARALAGRPDVLVADEPTSNLDPETADVVVSVLRQLHAQGKTVLIASHDARLLGEASAVFKLAKGRLAQGEESSQP